MQSSETSFFSFFGEQATACGKSLESSACAVVASVELTVVLTVVLYSSARRDLHNVGVRGEAKRHGA